jgi:hypothetical protein
MTIFTYEARTTGETTERVACGLFTSGDIDVDDAAHRQQFVEDLAVVNAWPVPLELRLWWARWSDWETLDEHTPDLVWSYAGGTP